MTMDVSIQHTSGAPSTQLLGPSLWIARGAWAAVLLLVLSIVATNLPHLLSDTRQDWQVGEALFAARSIFPSTTAYITYIAILRLIAALVFASVALFLAWRKFDDWMVLFTSAALLLMIYLFGFTLNVDVLRYPEPLESAFPAIHFFFPMLIIAAVLGLFYLFPDGNLYPRWIILAALFGLAISALFMYAAFNPSFQASWDAYEASNSLAVLPEEWGWLLFVFSLLGAIAVGLLSRLLYYRHEAGAVQRQQMKLVLLSMGALLMAPILTGVLQSSNLLTNSWRFFIALHIDILLPIILPLSIGAAVLRYRLWEVDVLVNRTLVYSALTAAILMLYVLVVGVLGNLFQSGSSLLLSILATGLIAVLFNPLRQRLQQGVNRMMYGQRDDPLSILTELGRQLENMAVPGQTLPALVETIAGVLKLPYVAIETVTEDAGRQLVAAAAPNGRRPPGVQYYRLAYQGATVGDLLVAPRADGETFTVGEERLLRNIARQAGTAVYAYQLTSQLQRSRERLVTAREEERRRLRRDLHDGLGPQLATLTVKVDAARNLLQSDPEAAQQLLSGVKVESQQAIAEIRRVVDGLRPPALDQLGLISALHEFMAQYDAGSNTQLHLELPGHLPPLPAAVEVVVYRIVTEAVTNVMRHAEARTCTVRIRNESNTKYAMHSAQLPAHQFPRGTSSANQNYLCLEIRDDGLGHLSDYAPGVGHTSMRERALELGGVFELESAPGQGTAVRVALPITQPKDSHD